MKLRSRIQVTVIAVVFLRGLCLNADAVYGDLKQSDVPECPARACGPVAAVNSFVYLQTKYPEIYTVGLAALVGLADDQPPPLHWEQLAASILAGPEFMGTCCGGGTPIEKFILGKQAYIEDVIPGRTSYKAEMDIPWRPDVAGSSGHPVDKPSYVDDSTFPTAAFLRKEIADGEDVELLLFLGNDSHYVTLTSIGPPEDGVGDMNWVDPITGKTLQDGAVYQIVKDGFSSHLEVTYENPTTHKSVTGNISAAVSESPVPEPSSIFLLTTCLAIIAFVLCRRSTSSRTQDFDSGLPALPQNIKAGKLHLWRNSRPGR
jgi:hypothetical protein